MEIDPHFAEAIDAWKEKYKLRDDDPVLLFIELFRLHQEQWDELRRRDLPSFQRFREDIEKLEHASTAFRAEATALVELLRIKGANAPRGITAGTAVFCITLALLAGLILGGLLP